MKMSIVKMAFVSQGKRTTIYRNEVAIRSKFTSALKIIEHEAQFTE
jgi:hypothetical protein